LKRAIETNTNFIPFIIQKYTLTFISFAKTRQVMILGIVHLSRKDIKQVSPLPDTIISEIFIYMVYDLSIKHLPVETIYSIDKSLYSSPTVDIRIK
jgi:hypothetical protein